jgi:hypothetical protein
MARPIVVGTDGQRHVVTRVESNAPGRVRYRPEFDRMGGAPDGVFAHMLDIIGIAANTAAARPHKYREGDGSDKGLPVVNSRNAVKMSGMH